MKTNHAFIVPLLAMLCSIASASADSHTEVIIWGEVRDTAGNPVANYTAPISVVAAYPNQKIGDVPLVSTDANGQFRMVVNFVSHENREPASLNSASLIVRSPSVAWVDGKVDFWPARKDKLKTTWSHDHYQMNANLFFEIPPQKPAPCPQHALLPAIDEALARLSGAGRPEGRPDARSSGAARPQTPPSSGSVHESASEPAVAAI